MTHVAIPALTGQIEVMLAHDPSLLATVNKAGFVRQPCLDPGGGSDARG